MGRLLLCASWHSMHCFFAVGLCCDSAADCSWHAKQIWALGIERFSVVMSPCVLATWQMVHEVAIAECTDVPLILFA
jgi:hypothetical protein